MNRSILPCKDVAAGQADAERFQRLYNLIIQDLMVKGDSLFFQKNEDYAGALTYYRLAQDSLEYYRSINYDFQGGRHGELEWRVNPVRIGDQAIALAQRAESALRTLVIQFDIRQRDVETFLEARAWNQALRSLEAMHALLPDRAIDRGRLRDRLHLEGDPKDDVEREMERCRRMLE